MKRRHFISTAAMTSVGAACLGQLPVKAAAAETHKMTISNTESFVVHSDHVGASRWTCGWRIRSHAGMGV